MRRIEDAKVHEGEWVTFVNRSDEYPAYKGKTYRGRIDGHYEKDGPYMNRVMYCTFWPNGEDKSGCSVGIGEIEVIMREKL